MAGSISVSVRSLGVLACALLGACGADSARPPERAESMPRWRALTSPTSESLRGLSVVDERVVWASGAHGTVLRSVDGGESWTVTVVEGAEAIDFRSLHAFDRDRAVVVAAGAPARAFRSEDAGAHWTETYTRDVLGIFFDSIAFSDEAEGLAIGDPLPGADGSHFALLVTHDGGANWEEREGPLAAAGEAAFAASNGCLALPAPGLALFATGGAVARVFRSADGGGHWASVEVPVAHGPASAGIFSIAFEGASVGYVVGGDYAAPTEPGSFARSDDGGVTWQAGAPLRGFRSSIAVRGEDLLVVGTSGSELSRDGGETWTPIGDEPLNAVRISGASAFAVGPGGSLARLTLAGAR